MESALVVDAFEEFGVENIVVGKYLLILQNKLILVLFMQKPDFGGLLQDWIIPSIHILDLILSQVGEEGSRVNHVFLTRFEGNFHFEDEGVNAVKFEIGNQGEMELQFQVLVLEDVLFRKDP